jgi:exodeoxyribonuclease-3
LNIYFPNGGGGPERLKFKLKYYDLFLEYINSLRKKRYEIIFCGDVNTAHTEIDLARPKENVKNTGFLPIERAWLDKVIASDYVDTFRALNPQVKDIYTYWDMKTFARERNVGWRIDYFFVSKNLLKKVKKVEVFSHVLGSDHCPISLEIDI